MSSILEKKVKVQKATLGYNYKQILKLIKTVKSLGGFDIQILTLPNGAFNRHFSIQEITTDYIDMTSGLVSYRITA